MSPHIPLVGRDVFCPFSLRYLKTIKNYIYCHSAWGSFIVFLLKRTPASVRVLWHRQGLCSPPGPGSWARAWEHDGLSIQHFRHVFTTCSLTDGEFFLPSSRKITHSVFLLITAALLPGSQNHYRSCSICHSWYTFPRQSGPQLALCCTDHHMFQYTAVLFQLHPRGEEKLSTHMIPRQSLQLHLSAL